MPYYPDEDEISSNTDGTEEVDNNIADDIVGEDDDAIVFPDQIPEDKGKKDKNKSNGEDQIKRNKDTNMAPLWYDPIFTQIFNDLRNKYANTEIY